MRHNIVIPESILQVVNNALLNRYGSNVFSVELEDDKKRKFYACSWDMTQAQENEVRELLKNNALSKIEKVKKEEDRRKFTGFDKKREKISI